jgi:hypothetical protein
MLFNVARELDREGHNRNRPAVEKLSNESKSALGVFLDFVGVQRAYLLKSATGPSDLPTAETATSDIPPRLL